MSAVVEIQSFRGTRKASVYRELVVARADFARIADAAVRQHLTLLPSLDHDGPHELDKAEARRLAEEVTQLRSSAEVPELDGDLTALAEIAHWCSRAREDAWLTVAAAA